MSEMIFGLHYRTLFGSRLGVGSLPEGQYEDIKLLSALQEQHVPSEQAMATLAEAECTDTLEDAAWRYMQDMRNAGKSLMRKRHPNPKHYRSRGFTWQVFVDCCYRTYASRVADSRKTKFLENLRSHPARFILDTFLLSDDDLPEFARNCSEPGNYISTTFLIGVFRSILGKVSTKRRIWPTKKLTVDQLRKLCRRLGQSYSYSAYHHDEDLGGGYGRSAHFRDNSQDPSTTLSSPWHPGAAEGYTASVREKAVFELAAVLSSCLWSAHDPREIEACSSLSLVWLQALGTDRYT